MPGGGESSNQGSSQSQGSGSSYSQSASVSMPYNMNPTTGNLTNTEGLLNDIYTMLKGGASNNSLLQSFLAPYGGAMAAPVTGAQQSTLNNLGSAESGNYSFDPSLQAIYNQLVNEGTNPIGFAQQVAAGGTGANSAAGAGTNLASALFGGQATTAQSAGQLYGNLVSGGATNETQAGQNLASGLAGPGSPVVGEGQFAANLATSPTIQSVIQGAEQPITTAFNTQTVPGLQGSFAGAGQRATGGGSSAFDMAYGNAQAQEEAQLASVSSNIENNAYNEGISSYSNAYNTGANNYANAFNTGSGQFANAYSQGAGNYNTLYGSGLNLAGNAPGQISSLTSGELSNLISTLNAQALPQLTEQLGINNALSTYNNSIGSILQALGLQVQGEQPVIGYGSESLSNSASFTNEESSGQQSGSSFNFSLPGLL